MFKLWKPIYCSLIAAVALTSTAVAAPAMYTVSYNVTDVSLASGMPALSSAFEAGQVYKGSVSFDDAALSSDGFHWANLISFRANIGGNIFVAPTCHLCGGISNQYGFEQSSIGIYVLGGQLVQFDNFGINDASDRTYIDFFPSRGMPDFSARVNDGGALSVVNGTLAFERLPEPSGLSLTLAALVGVSAFGTMKRIS